MIAQKMRETINKPNKVMELVLEQGLHRKSLFTPITDLNPNELSDFPKLTKSALEEEINFGTFQLKHSLSNLAEHFNQHNGQAELSFNKQDSGEKIVTCKIHSRHFSTKEYRVYVSYQPFDILGWYCECKNRSRTLGSCCHVTALIYYLSVLRHQTSNPKQPAQSLLSIFPKHLNLNNTKDQKEKSQKSKKSTKKQKERFLESSQDELSSSESEIEIKKESSNPDHNKKIKQSQSAQNISILDKLYSKSPGWGGEIIEIKNIPATNRFKGFTISNTCSFDYFVHGMWISTLISDAVKSFLSNNISIDEFDKEKLNKMFSYIEKGNWNHVKSIWILEFLKLIPSEDHVFINTYLDSFQTFGKIIEKQQICNLSLTCDFCSRKIYKHTSSNFYYDINGQYSLGKHYCSKCRKIMSVIKGSENFLTKPAWLYFDINYLQKNQKLSCFRIPKRIEINELNFKLIIAQILVNENKEDAHFKGVFLINDSYFLLNDLDQGNRELKVPKKNKVTACLYYLET